MITKIFSGDVFSPKLQEGETRENGIDVVFATNTSGVSTRGVANQVGERFNPKFLDLLAGSGAKSVELGTVFTHPGEIDGLTARFHAIATNTRMGGGVQDWSELLPSLRAGLGHLALMDSIDGDEEAQKTADTALFQRILAENMTVVQAQISLQEHMDRTRRKFRTVLIGGADGLKNDANLQDTLTALAEAETVHHLYLGMDDAMVASVNKVIPFIPALKGRNLRVELAAAA